MYLIFQKICFPQSVQFCCFGAVMYGLGQKCSRSEAKKILSDLSFLSMKNVWCFFWVLFFKYDIITDELILNYMAPKITTVNGQFLSFVHIHQKSYQ